MNGQNRENVKIGLAVDIILKQDQAGGKLTRGVVADILTNSSFHPHGIKVRLESAGKSAECKILLHKPASTYL